MNRMLKPRPVRDGEPPMVVWFPDGHAALATDGQLVEMDLYWHRRIADGDVLVVDPAPTADPWQPAQTE